MQNLENYLSKPRPFFPRKKQAYNARVTGIIRHQLADFYFSFYTPTKKIRLKYTPTLTKSQNLKIVILATLARLGFSVCLLRAGNMPLVTETVNDYFGISTYIFSYKHNGLFISETGMRASSTLFCDSQAPRIARK